MEVLKIKHLSNTQKSALMNLWNQEYPKSLFLKNSTDFDTYLSSIDQAIHFLVIQKNEIVGWFVDFKREGENWFAMIIDRNHQHKGIGSMLLNQAKARHQKLLGWVIDQDNELRVDNSTYPSPIQFYIKNEFVVRKEVRLETPKISAVQIEWSRK